MIWWCFLVFAVVGVQGRPSFYDERQNGRQNVLANLTDINFIVIPPKELSGAAISMIPWREATDRFFRLAGLGKIATEENTTVQTPATQTSEATPESTSAVPNSSTTAIPIQKKKTTRKEESEELMLIQTGIEECGPEGHRDFLGICNYDVPSLNP